ncbi:MAG: zinc ribbon domain-containing protein [Bacteroidetes bacterium]|nr:zinc ribbon domain-containing protein [Bacteroidota bacterium]
MKKDPQQGGTNSDSTKNLMYCSYCYSNGVFP